MQTMTPNAWPAPAADPPPAPVPARATMSRGAKIFLGFLATILAFGIIGALGETTQDKTRAYSSGSTTAVDSPSESTTAGNSSSLSDWAQTYGVPDAQTIEDDTTAIAARAGAYDVAGIRRTCAKFHTDLLVVESHLPTPNASLTDAVSKAYGYYKSAAESCLAGDYEEAGNYTQLGTAQIQRATSIIQAN